MLQTKLCVEFAAFSSLKNDVHWTFACRTMRLSSSSKFVDNKKEWISIKNLAMKIKVLCMRGTRLKFFFPFVLLVCHQMRCIIGLSYACKAIQAIYIATNHKIAIEMTLNWNFGLKKNVERVRLAHSHRHIYSFVILIVRSFAGCSPKFHISCA